MTNTPVGNEYPVPGPKPEAEVCGEALHTPCGRTVAPSLAAAARPETATIAVRIGLVAIVGISKFSLGA